MVTFGVSGVADGGRTALAHVGGLHPTDFMFGSAIDLVCLASPISLKHLGPTGSRPKRSTFVESYGDGALLRFR